MKLRNKELDDKVLEYVFTRTDQEIAKINVEAAAAGMKTDDYVYMLFEKAQIQLEESGTEE